MRRASVVLVLMASIALWCATSAFHRLAPGLDEKILWAKVQYFGIAATGKGRARDRVVDRHFLEQLTLSAPVGDGQKGGWSLV